MEAIKFDTSFKKKVAVVLPAHNEELTIEDTIRSFHEISPKAYIVVVENASSDQTFEIANKVINNLGCGEVLRESSPGKGNAIRKAFLEIEADVYVMCDADSTYPASAIDQILAPVLQGEADMVVGDRHSQGDYRKKNKRPFHDFGNHFLKYLVNRLYNQSLKDILSGYRAFSRRFVKNWPVMSSGFEIEMEMTLHALDKRFKLVEVPIGYQDRPEGSHSKLSTFKDGIKIIKTLMTIFKDYKPLHFFGSLSAIFAASGLGFGSVVIIEYINTQFITHVPLAILSTGLMVISGISLAIGLILGSIANYQRLNFEHRLLQQSGSIKKD